MAWDNSLPVPMDGQAAVADQKQFSVVQTIMEQVGAGMTGDNAFVRTQVQLTHLRQTELFNSRAANALLGTDRSPTWPSGLVPAAINPNPVIVAGQAGKPVATS